MSATQKLPAGDFQGTFRPADAHHHVYGAIRNSNLLPVDRSRFAREQGGYEALPEQLAVYLSIGLIGFYAVGFVARFMTHYLL